MELKEYLTKHDISQNKFSKSIRYSANHLRSVMYKRRKASPKMIEAIERMTNGEVKAEDL